MLKNGLFILLGCVLGGGIVATLMYPQIQNRYTMGVNTGYINGGNHIIDFLAKNINNQKSSNEPQKRKVIDLNTYLHHKVSTISVLEIDGVKTISVK